MTHRVERRAAWTASYGALTLLTVALSITALQTPATVPAAIPMTRVDVNTAPASHLQLLEGVGPKLAAAIIADREAHGLYSSVDDLDRVPRIGARTVARLAPDATVGP